MCIKFNTVSSMPLASLCLYPLYTAKQPWASVYISRGGGSKCRLEMKKRKAGKEGGRWLIFKMEMGHLTLLALWDISTPAP